MDNNDDTINSQSLPDLNQESEPTIKDQPTEEKVEPKKDTQPDKTEDNKQRPQPKPKTSKTKKNKWPLIVIIILFVLIAGTAIFITVYSFTSSNNNQYSIIENEETKEEKEEKEEEKAYNLGDISISGNDINDFDLAFLKLEDDGEENIVYSPLSIKYALTMLSSGSAGETKKQIDDILGTYNLKTYTNSENLSLANALFVNETHQDKIKSAYINNLRENYNAELLFDSFATSDAINSWIENKTLGLLKDPLKESDPTNIFYLINALAIDMEWINKIQTPVGGTPFSEYHDENHSYLVSFPHENVAGHYVEYLNEKNYDASSFGAAANKYDIINDLGEDKIRSTVQKEYEKWAEEQRERNDPYCQEDRIASQAPDLDEYVDTLKKHYGHISSSTDFYYYDDDEVNAFAKDLKTYGNTTLQYIAIKPKDTKNSKPESVLIEDYIANISATKIDNIIKNLKDLNWDSYEDGYVTTISGWASRFDFQHDLKLMEDLEAIGIKDVFSPDQADLSGISDEEGVFIKEAIHSANIGFSNDGIKASAATILGGGKGGAGECSYNYYFEVPKKEIRLNFYSNFIFLIRDKDSGEIWFAGTVHNPRAE